MSLAFDERWSLVSTALAEIGAIVELAPGRAAREAALKSESSVRAACAAHGDTLKLRFSADSVLVGGRMLAAPRTTWQSVRRLATRLTDLGVLELEIDSSVTRRELLSFGTAVADGHGLERALAGISITRREREAAAPRSEAARVLHAYAAALLAVRELHTALAHGNARLTRAVKHAALQLAASEPGPAWLGLTALASAHRDDAGRAVQTAVLALSIARELTRDAALLEEVALAALSTDAGRPWLTAHSGRSPDVDAALEEFVPAATAAACLAASSTEGAAWRAALAFEVAWLERGALLGALYDGALPPMLVSEILRLARSYLDGVAPRDGRQALSPPDALRALGARDDMDPTLFALVHHALGELPPTTVVELSTREWAVVAGRSANGSAVRPLVRVVTDSRGEAHARPKDLDLGTSEAAPAILGVVPPGQARFNVAFTFFGAIG